MWALRAMILLILVVLSPDVLTDVMVSDFPQMSQLSTSYLSLTPPTAQPGNSPHCASIIYETGSIVGALKVSPANGALTATHLGPRNTNASAVIQATLDQGGLVCIRSGIYNLDHGL